MNVRIFWVRAMKCMCAQTRPRFILSSERVFGGMEFEPMLTPREKYPLPENFPRGGSNPRRCGQQAQTLPTSYSGPRIYKWMLCLSFSEWGTCRSPQSPEVWKFQTWHIQIRWTEERWGKFLSFIEAVLIHVSSVWIFVMSCVRPSVTKSVQSTTYWLHFLSHFSCD